MAAKKRAPKAETMSLFAAPSLAQAAPKPVEETTMPLSTLGAIPRDPDDDTPAPKLRLVPPPAEEEEIVVRAHGDGRYWIEKYSETRGAHAAILYTRTQLEKLLKRIPGALAVG
jgi:hypothetical protein